jgi:trans-2,3-dihydro-3-hydroxyanthranilate isomerase
LLDGRPFSSEEMQNVARELNIAETVFLLPPQEGGDVLVRIFTPGTELPFAGSPVLGTAFVVGAALGRDEVTLETGAGPVPIRLEREGDRIVFGRMEQPVPVWEPYDQERELFAALGVSGSRLPVELYRNGPPHVYVALENDAAVAALTPDFAALTELNIAANCFAGSGRNWKTRMFYPAAGIAEDPATGSAAGPLAIHLARHGEIAFGDEIEIVQGVEMARPSLLYAVASGSAEQVDSVHVGGVAVMVAEGVFRTRQ